MKAREQFYKAYGIRLTRGKHLEVLLFLLCMEVVLAFSFLGFIQIPPISVTTLSISVVVTAMLFGPLEGMAAAVVFAAASMWKASVTSVELGDIIFSPVLSGKPLESLVMALVTRVLFALIAGVLFRWFFSRERKHRGLGIALISVVTTAIHALLVYACMLMFFQAGDVQTGSSFSQSLLLNNLILYSVTVLVALGFDALLRNKTIRYFFEKVSVDNIKMSKRQRSATALLTVAILLMFALICLHFVSRVVGFISTENGGYGNDNLSWTYSLLLQLVIGLGAAFGIIVLFFRWVQEYFSTLYSENKKEEQIREELIQNNARFFALEDNFESLYDVEIESGRYVSYVKGDFYQTNVIDKLVTPTDYFADLRSNIDAVIYPDDRDGLYNVLTRVAIRRELAENDHFDYYYRVMTDKGLAWFKMRLVYKNAEKKNVIIGVFDAKNDMAEKEKNSRLIAAFASENEVSVLLDLKTGLYTLLSNRGNIPEKITSLLHHKDPGILYAERFVHPDDRESFYSDIYTAAGAKARLAVGESVSYEYRGKIDNEYAWYRAVFNRVSEDEVVIGFRNCNEEILNRNLSEKVISDFASVFLVDLDNDTFRFVSRNSESGFADIPGGVYSETIREYASRVNPDYREMWNKFSDVDAVRELLTHESRVEYVYPLEGVEKRWRRCILQTLYTENGVPSSIIMTYFVLDDASAENLELSRKNAEQKALLEEDMQMIGGLASGYYALYYFNINENSFKVYALDGKKLPKAAEIVGAGGKGADAFSRFANSDLVHPEDRKLFTELSIDALRERLAHRKKFTVRFRRKFGEEYRWTEMDVVKYEGVEEQANGIALGFADRDADIRKEQEVLKELSDAREAADAANQSKSNFLFNMSHDIRTPMNAIRGFTAMAKKNVGNEDKVVEYLDKIEISGQQLLSLINQVLEMARIESGKIELEEKPIDVREEFNSMVTVLAEQANTNGLIFKHSIWDVEHFHVLADEARMSSVTLNLVGNAMKYTPEGGTVECCLREIPARKPGYATFIYSVADTGIGMSQEYLKHLYTPFSREKSSTVSKIQGTGLGLSIVKSVIDLMGGSIEVQSELGKGTRFDITVDFRIDDNAGSEVEKTENTGMVSFKGCRVLLVEDNEMNREIARDILEEQGLIVEDAEDGDIAVSKVRDVFDSGEYGYYDFILMDIQMPRMNGYEASKEIRAIPWPEGVYIPIIAMTANAFEEDRKNALAAGMDEHIAKPIDVQKMFRTIAKFL